MKQQGGRKEVGFIGNKSFQEEKVIFIRVRSYVDGVIQRRLEWWEQKKNFSEVKRE